MCLFLKSKPAFSKSLPKEKMLSAFDMNARNVCNGMAVMTHFRTFLIILVM